MNRIVSLVIALVIVSSAFFLDGCLDAVNDVPPFIQSISPTIGTANTQVTIKGTDFEISPAGNSVKFNGKSAIIVSGNPFEIVVLVPQDAGTGKVTVTTSVGTAEGPEFKYLDPLTIESIQPLSGRFGEEITITGTNFDDFPGGTVVRFNGTAANVVSLTKSQIVVKVPEGAGTGRITVRTGAGIVEGPIFEYLFTATVSTYAGDGTPGFANSTLLESKFNLPSALAFDLSDNLLICDRSNNLIRKIEPDGTVSTFVGSGSPSSVDGTGVSASFAAPNFIVIDADGNSFVTEALSGNLRKVTIDGEVSTFAGNGTSSFADGTGTAASFNTPAALVMNAQRQIFLSDQGNYRIRQVTPEAVVTTLAGDGVAEQLDGTGSAARFIDPYGIVIDAIGDVLVTDGNKIRKVSLEGAVSTFTGKETSGWVDGSVQTAEFNGPRGMTKWRNESILIADTDNHVIRMITSSGTVITIAGDGQSGYINGNGAEARFNFPNAIAVNSKFEIFVADRLNHVIRKIVLK